MRPEEYCRRYYRMLRQWQQQWQQPELIFKTKKKNAAQTYPQSKQPLKLLQSVMEEIMVSKNNVVAATGER
jgi:protein-disulfide isomerase